MSQNKETKHKQKDNLLGSPSSYSEEHGKEGQSDQDRAPSTLVKPYHSNIQIYSTIPPPGSCSTLCMEFTKDSLEKQLRGTRVNAINLYKKLAGIEQDQGSSYLFPLSPKSGPEKSSFLIIWAFRQRRPCLKPFLLAKKRVLVFISGQRHLWPFHQKLW